MSRKTPESRPISTPISKLKAKVNATVSSSPSLLNEKFHHYAFMTQEVNTYLIFILKNLRREHRHKGFITSYSIMNMTADMITAERAARGMY